MFLNRGNYYNSAALYGGCGGDYTDSQYFGGFVPMNPAPRNVKDLVDAGRELYLNRDIGLKQRDKLSLQYAVASGKTTPDHIYMALGALYASDTLRRAAMMAKTAAQRDEIATVMWNIRSALPPIGPTNKGGNPQMTIAWTKVNKIMHPKQRIPKKVRAYIRDNTAPWRKGSWGRFLKHVPAMSPEKRAAMRARLRGNPQAFLGWKEYYGSKGNHRAPLPSLEQAVRRAVESAPPAAPSAKRAAVPLEAAAAAAPVPALPAPVPAAPPVQFVAPSVADADQLAFPVAAKGVTKDVFKQIYDRWNESGQDPQTFVETTLATTYPPNVRKKIIDALLESADNVAIDELNADDDDDDDEQAQM